MKGTGKMIYRMEKVLRDGLMDQSMKVIIYEERNTDMEYISGATEADSKETGMRIKSQD